MSLVTRCTSCGTLFKVVADQLKISEGWVRCGQCACVFDAQANLVDAADSETTPPHNESTWAQTSPPATDTPPRPLSSHIASDISPVDPAPSSAADIASEIQSFRASKLQSSGMMGAYIAARTSPVPASNAAPLETPTNASLRSDEPTTLFPSSTVDDSALPEPAIDQSVTEQQSNSQAQAEPATPSFVKEAQRAARWRSPWVRLGLSMVALLLLAGLALQVVLHDKDRIAAQWPQTKPWLDQFCVEVGCQVQPLRRIEAIAVDASSFNRINKNNAQIETITQSYRLAVTLKNTGTLPVALPHMELSLQDAQDVSVLRRVLSPADLGAGQIALTPSQDLTGSVTLQIDTAQLAGSRIQGYRVLAFYP